MTSDTAPTYLAYAPEFDINNGGSIFVHRLVHELRALGEQAYIYPMPEEEPTGRRAMLRHWLDRLFGRGKSSRKPFNTGKDFDTPLYTGATLPENAIVIYTEYTAGNPLGAANVARWLLYKPGYLGRPKTFAKDELFFKGSDFSDDPSISGGAQLLQLFWTNPCYRDLGYPNRSGSCYMMRKRENEGVEHSIEGSVNVDGLSHEDLAEVFNRCETFYCYDDATMYSQYAALCGCDSVVIPWHYPSRKEWAAARPIGTYGVAYGLDDLEHARRTRPLLAANLQQLEEDGLSTVRSFVSVTKARFGFSTSSP